MEIYKAHPILMIRFKRFKHENNLLSKSKIGEKIVFPLIPKHIGSMRNENRNINKLSYPHKIEIILENYIMIYLLFLITIFVVVQAIFYSIKEKILIFHLIKVK